MNDRLLQVFFDIIEGKTVKRCKHELVYEGKDVSQLFIESLMTNDYLPITVSATQVMQGERIPAFYIENTTAYFGWVFWEKFNSRIARKLFGSVERNEKGDWKIQIPPSRDTIIYANENLKLEMDIEHPFEW
ncbi:MAG: hypothetical protein KGZ58_08060 [Ignavibacteriales bacterium]|nr:hypothetical protein [Ignavibacteriales bacterium]